MIWILALSFAIVFALFIAQERELSLAFGLVLAAGLLVVWTTKDPTLGAGVAGMVAVGQKGSSQLLRAGATVLVWAAGLVSAWLHLG